MEMYSVGWGMTRGLIVKLGLLLFLGCAEKTALNRSAQKPPEVVEPQQADSGSIRARVGQKFVVKGPAIPVHPHFAEAKTVPEFDSKMLALQSEDLDTQRMGASFAVFEFKALKPGNGNLLLKLVSNGRVEKSKSYVVEVTD